MKQSKNQKAQVTIEFLFSFTFYLLFILILVSSVNHFSNELKNKNENFECLIKTEKIARIFDSFYSFNRHFSIKLENSYLLNANLLYNDNCSIAIETLYPGEDFDAEPM